MVAKQNETSERFLSHCNGDSISLKQNFLRLTNQPNKKKTKENIIIIKQNKNPQRHNGGQSQQSYSWMSSHGHKCSVDKPVHGLCHVIVPNNETMSWSDKILESAVVSVQQDNYTFI